MADAIQQVSPLGASTPETTTAAATTAPAPAQVPATPPIPPAPPGGEASIQTTNSVVDSKGSKNPSLGTQVYLPFSEIHDDTVILKNGGIRAVLRTTSINFNLKSEQEQNALAFGYQSFLNSLEFPVQIVIRSRKLDIDKYIQSLKEKVIHQSNPLLQKQTYEYIDFISRLVEYADIMEKDFLVIIPYDPPRAQSINFVEKLLQMLKSKDTEAEVKKRRLEFETLNKGLSQRVTTIQGGLENLGLKVNQLNTQQLIELFYNTYNPVVGRNEKVEDASKFNLEK